MKRRYEWNAASFERFQFEENIVLKRIVPEVLKIISCDYWITLEKEIKENAIP